MRLDLIGFIMQLEATFTHLLKLVGKVYIRYWHSCMSFFRFNSDPVGLLLPFPDRFVADLSFLWTWHLFIWGQIPVLFVMVYKK